MFVSLRRPEALDFGEAMKQVKAVVGEAWEVREIKQLLPKMSGRSLVVRGGASEAVEGPEELFAVLIRRWVS